MNNPNDDADTTITKEEIAAIILAGFIEKKKNEEKTSPKNNFPSTRSAWKDYARKFYQGGYWE